MTKRKWTKTDLRTMKSMVVRRLRRSEGAVFQKAHTMGLSLLTR